MNHSYNKIGLLDHMGGGNLGNAATQDAIIGGIRRRCPNALIYGFSLYPHDTVQRHNIPSYPIRRGSEEPTTAAAPRAHAPSYKTILKQTLRRNQLLYRLAAATYHLLQELIFLIES